MQSLEELNANLAQYKAQAEQVQSLLALDPSNEQFKSLASDLADATRLTEQLIKAQTTTGDGGEAAEASTVPTEPLHLRKEPAASAAATSSNEPWTPKVGDRVEAPYGEKRYPAVILALEAEGDAQKAAIKYYGYPDVESKPLSDLSVLHAVPGGELEVGQATVGFECQAKWIGDGQWYDAVVEGLVEHGYKVKFTRYGNEAEVPLEYLKPRLSAAAAGGEGAGGVGGQRPPKRPAPEGTSQVKEFVIPDHLRLLPTDSEEEKQRKRKKVKHLKAQWKQRHAGALEAQEEAAGGGAGSWKDYLNKSKKKSAAAKGLGALKKGSIFASPDTVDGRVGVVGSGQGMTEFEKRQTFIKRNVQR